MKKSHLIFLLCLLFCGQMFAQRPTPTTPSNPKNPDAPTMTIGITEDPPTDPCDGVDYGIKIDDVVCDATSADLIEMVPLNYTLSNSGDIPDDVFDIVKISLNHPLVFTSYGFELTLEQSGSSKPVVLLFTDAQHQIEIAPVPQFVDGPTKLYITITNNGGNTGGVATNVPVEDVWGGNGEQCVSVSVEGQELESGIFYEMCGDIFNE